MEEAYFTPKERAERLKVTVPAVYDWIDREQLYAMKLQGVGAHPQVSVRGIAEAFWQITEAEKRSAQEPTSQ
jgi:hypothetical protein